ncbi:MAG: hypothetical protein JJU05_12330 [Verrucomicrobia bacterium]|nr:hypothetical protein [Verrucomicrobiota bacterium]MCH8528367.1 hypothetical protein [Kiritimatiellia bacterium]
MSRKRPYPKAFWPWVFIFLMLFSLVWMMNRLTRQVREAQGCEQNLLRIYDFLRMYENDHGYLPSLKMFPQDALNDPESLVHILKPYGLDPADAVCPAASGVLREHGISYLWNTALNNTSLVNRLEPTWVLVDLQALDDRVPGPHFGGYNILYTDRRVERTLLPPHSLPVQFD